MHILKSILLFILAGLCEIGGGFLVWLWLKEDKSLLYGVLGLLLLGLYGIAAAMQSTEFGRTYATYGGIFIIMSLLWAIKFDKFLPDKYDIIGAIISLIGVCVICYAPRKI